tara:strand:- start:806 stop:1609 length:804 start_codon:yes stop_codon:yes gene_type:complete
MNNSISNFFNIPTQYSSSPYYKQALQTFFNDPTIDDRYKNLFSGDYTPDEFAYTIAPALADYVEPPEFATLPVSDYQRAITKFGTEMEQLGSQFGSDVDTLSAALMPTETQFTGLNISPREALEKREDLLGAYLDAINVRDIGRQTIADSLSTDLKDIGIDYEMLLGGDITEFISAIPEELPDQYTDMLATYGKYVEMEAAIRGDFSKESSYEEAMQEAENRRYNWENAYEKGMISPEDYQYAVSMGWAESGIEEPRYLAFSGMVGE